MVKMSYELNLAWETERHALQHATGGRSFPLVLGQGDGRSCFSVKKGTGRSRGHGVRGTVRSCACVGNSTFPFVFF